jgi:hypothetical protein
LALQNSANKPMEEGDSGSILYACVNSNGNGHQQIEIQVSYFLSVLLINVLLTGVFSGTKRSLQLFSTNAC